MHGGLQRRKKEEIEEAEVKYVDEEQTREKFTPSRKGRHRWALGGGDLWRSSRYCNGWQSYVPEAGKKDLGEVLGRWGNIR